MSHQNTLTFASLMFDHHLQTLEVVTSLCQWVFRKEVHGKSLRRILDKAPVYKSVHYMVGTRYQKLRRSGYTPMLQHLAIRVLLQRLSRMVYAHTNIVDM